MSFMVDPYRFVAGEPAFWVETVRVGMNTSTGDQDITVAGLDYTPKGARFILNGATGDGDGLKSENGCGSIGATDGSNSWGLAWRGEGTLSGRVTSTSNVIIELASPSSGTTVTAAATFVSFIEGGVRINVNDAPLGSVLITVELYGGTDLSVDCGTFTGAAAGADTTVTTGFQTNLMYAAGSALIGFPGSSTTGIFCEGYMSFDGTTIRQSCGAHSYNTPGGTRTTQGGVSSRLWRRSNPSLYMNVTAVGATTVTVQSVGASLTGDGIGYIAFNFGGAAEAWTGVVDSPTATGNQDIGAASFTPSFAMLHSGYTTAVDVDQVDGQSFAFAFNHITDSDFYCNQHRSTDAAGSGGTVDDFAEAAQALHMEDHRSLNDIDATFVGFVSGGVRLNFTNAPGGTQKWPLVLIG